MSGRRFIDLLCRLIIDYVGDDFIAFVVILFYVFSEIKVVWSRYRRQLTLTH